MVLWWVLFFSELMFPAIMIGVGLGWQKHPPKEINYVYGYRTTRSMRNQKTWDFAHKKAAEVWLKWGYIVLLIVVAELAFFYGKPERIVGPVGAAICLLECIPLIAVLIPVENALKKNFDKHGEPITGKREKVEEVSLDKIDIPKGYTIRTMKYDDWPYVQRIYGQGIHEGKSTFSTEIPDFTEWDHTYLSDCRYVICKEDKVVGWCGIISMSKKPAYWGTVEVSIYIDDAYRKQGLGQALLKHLCIESEKLGYWSLYACICAQNEGSIHLHEKCGFRMIGRREAVAKDIFGKWQDTVLLERRNSIR